MAGFSVRTVLEHSAAKPAARPGTPAGALVAADRASAGAPDALLGAGAAVAGRGGHRARSCARTTASTKRSPSSTPPACPSSRARRAGSHIAGRGHGRRGGHGQCDPRRQPRRRDARPAQPSRSASMPRSRRALANWSAAEQRRMTRLRDSIAGANRDSLTATAGFAVVAVLLAWLCGFVISWSFIVPVREAQSLLARGRRGRLQRRDHGAQPRRVRRPRRRG